MTLAFRRRRFARPRPDDGWDDGPSLSFDARCARAVEEIAADIRETLAALRAQLGRDAFARPARDARGGAERRGLHSGRRMGTPQQPRRPEGELVDLSAARARRALGEFEARQSSALGPGEVLRSAQAADLLQVSTKTLLKWARAGHVPAREVGKEWRFLRSELLDWLQRQEGNGVR